MYGISKIFQATGLTILLVTFLKNFPNVMSYRMLGLGIGIFMTGWIMNKFLLKNDKNKRNS